MKGEKCQLPVEDDSLSLHWDTNFTNKDIQNWIETGEPAIIKWFDQYAIPTNARIFCAGVGDSNIVIHLLNAGYEHIIANDISQAALDKLGQKINQHSSVSFVADNLVAPKHLAQYHGEVDVFIDRATLHFFTKPSDQAFYFNQLSDLLKPNGYYMLGVFGLDNRPKCCGLDLQLWSEASIKEKLPAYQFHDVFEQAFVELNGNVRNYLYMLGQKAK